MKKTNFRGDIEGLRGLAVLLVVAFHSGLPPFRGGFIGVDIFFVISGYLITGLLVTETQRTGRINFIAFYARRGRRLVPAAVLTISLATFGAFIFLSPYEAKEISKAALAAILFSSNIWFVRESTDYFAPDITHNSVLHTWSLGVEEQFYLVWPLLILLCVHLSTKRSQPRLTIVVIVAVSLISFAGCVAVTQLTQPVAFFAMPTRAWQFGTGALVYLIPWQRLNHRVLSFCLGIVGGLTVIIAGVTFSRYDAGFPGPLAAIPTLGAAAILLSGQFRPSSGVGWLLSRREFQLVGRLSYSWYLWHWPAIAFAGAIWPNPSWLEVVGAVLVSFALAALTYTIVENPVRYSRFLLPRPRISLSVCAGLTTIGVAFALISYGVAKAALLSPEQEQLSAAAAFPARYMNCDAPSLERSVKECSFGDFGSSYNVVLFGDSHALQWLPALERIATKDGWRLVTLIKTACPAIQVTVYNTVLKRKYYECDAWRADALKRIIQLNPSLAIISSYVGYLLPQPGGSSISLAQWSAGTTNVFARLAKAGIPAVLIGDTPRPGFDVITRLSRLTWRGSPKGECSIPRSLAVNEEIFAREKTDISRFTSARVVDFSDKICERSVCSCTKDGIPVYRDSHHLSAQFVKMLTPEIERALLNTGAAEVSVPNSNK